MTSAVGARRGWWPRVMNGVIVLVGLWVAVPLLYMIVLSISPDSQIGGGRLLPTRIAWDNFASMWTTISLAKNLKNSIVISAGTALLATAVALGMAYVLGRFRFRGRRTILYALITLQTIPGVMLLLPLFIVIAALQDSLAVHLVGQYYTVILTYLTFALPFSAWLLLSYFHTLPKELEEAARIDGAGRWDVLRYVVFPLMLPGMVVTFVFSFLLAWNDVLFASVLTNQTTQTLGVGLEAFLSTATLGAQPYWGQLMAASLVSAAPVVILFLFFQRYLVGGLTLGGVKG